MESAPSEASTTTSSRKGRRKSWQFGVEQHGQSARPHPTELRVPQSREGLQRRPGACPPRLVAIQVDGKEFHYFLSHKKEHSKYGSVPGHVALNLHDSLQLLGFRGWCEPYP